MATAASVRGTFKKKQDADPNNRITFLFVIGMLIMLGSVVALQYLLMMFLNGATSLTTLQHDPGLLDDPTVDIFFVSATGVIGGFLLAADWALSKDRKTA